MHFERDIGDTRRIIQAVDPVYPDTYDQRPTLETARVEVFSSLAMLASISPTAAVDTIVELYRIRTTCGASAFRYFIATFSNHCSDWDESLSSIGAREMKSKQAAHKERESACTRLEAAGYAELAARIREQGRVEA